MPLPWPQPLRPPYPQPGEQRLVPPQRVRTHRGLGTLFKVTYWGQGRVRWWWVRHDNGEEHAYQGSQLHNPGQAALPQR